MRASLIGKAPENIRNLSFSNDNYTTAWKSLYERYNDKRILIFKHIRALFFLEQIQKESSGKLRHIVDCTTKNLRSLKLLFNEEQLSEALLIYLVTSKLDPTTNCEWEEKQTSDKFKYLELEDFLKLKASLLEEIE